MALGFGKSNVARQLLNFQCTKVQQRIAGHDRAMVTLITRLCRVTLADASVTFVARRSGRFAGFESWQQPET